MTNREKFRQMSNEELAEWVDTYAVLGCNTCAYKEINNCGTECVKGCIEWLESEAEP